MARTSRAESTHEDAARPTEESPIRVPVASNRAPLTYRGLDRENFEPRWVLDKDDRIALFLEAGYSFVPKRANTVGDKTVDSKTLDTRVSKSSGGRSLFLMQLPKQFYNDDQKAKQRAVDELDESMKRPGKGNAVNESVDYGSIKLDRGPMPSS